MELWSESWAGFEISGFGINGEFVGTRDGVLQRIELYSGERVTHAQYGVGHHLKYKFFHMIHKIPKFFQTLYG